MEQFSENNNEYANTNSEEELEDLEDPEEGLDDILEALENEYESDTGQTELDSAETEENGQEHLDEILNEIREALPEEYNQLAEEQFDDLPSISINESLIINSTPRELLYQWMDKVGLDQEKINELQDPDTLIRYNIGKMHFHPQALTEKPKGRKMQKEVLYTLYASALKLALTYNEETPLREERNDKQKELEELHTSTDYENISEREEQLRAEIQEYNGQIHIPQHLYGFTPKEMAKFLENKFGGQSIKMESEEDGKYAVYANLEALRDPDYLEDLLDSFKRVSKIIETLEEKENPSLNE